MKVVADVLGVSRSNLHDRLKGAAKPRRRYHKAQDAAGLPSPFKVRIKDEGRALGQGEVSILSGSTVICSASYNTEEYYARYSHGMGKEAGPQHEGAAIGLMRKAITIAAKNEMAYTRGNLDAARAVRALDAYLANQPMPEDDGPQPS